MAQVPIRVDDFRSKLVGGGARANMFSVDVTFPGYAGGDTEITSFMCRSAQLPASIIGLVEVPFRGRIVKLAGDRTFEPWTITVYKGDKKMTYYLRNAFPTNVAAIDLDFAQVGEIEQFQVTIEYDYWVNDNTN
jgi:hypothetical protein